MGNRAGYLRVTEQFASFRKTCMSKSTQIAATASGINWICENCSGLLRPVGLGVVSQTPSQGFLAKGPY